MSDQQSKLRDHTQKNKERKKIKKKKKKQEKSVLKQCFTNKNSQTNLQKILLMVHYQVYLNLTQKM